MALIKDLIDTISGNLFAKNQADRENKLYRSLMRHEAKLGGTVFGEIPEGRRREFFCLDEYTWVWHEEWTNEQGQHKVMTTRYDIRPSGVLKSQNGSHYQPVSNKEALRLLRATRLYQDKVKKEIYTFA